MKGKTFLLITMLLIIVFCVDARFADSAETREKWPKAVSIGVPSVGSAAYIIYAGFGEMMRKHLNVTGTAEAVGGSTAILSLMIRKKLQFAQVSTDVIYDSVRGLGSYKDKKTEIRQICPAISFSMFFFVRPNSGIKKPEDMRGKRILVYSPTSAPVTLCADMLLKSIGLTRKDVIAMPIIGQPDGVRAMNDGTADGFIWAGSPLAPVSAFAEMANSVDVRLIGITENQQKFIVDNSHGVLSASEIKGGQYKGNPDTIRSISYDVPLVSLPEIPEDLVYEMTKLIFGKEHRQEFIALHPTARTFMTQRLEKEPPLTPYHKGAIKLYKEIGVWSKKMEDYQAKVLRELGLKE